MQSAFFRAVCQTGIFMICAQTITHFRPNSSYEKYLKLLVSVMVLIQIFRPIGALFTKGEGWALESRILQIGEQLDIGLGQAAEEASRAEQVLERMTLMEVQELLEEQASEAYGEEQIPEGMTFKEVQELLEGQAAEGAFGAEQVSEGMTFKEVQELPEEQAEETEDVFPQDAAGIQVEPPAIDKVEKVEKIKVGQ